MCANNVLSNIFGPTDTLLKTMENHDEEREEVACSSPQELHVGLQNVSGVYTPYTTLFIHPTRSLAPQYICHTFT